MAKSYEWVRTTAGDLMLVNGDYRGFTQVLLTAAQNESDKLKGRLPLSERIAIHNFLLSCHDRYASAEPSQQLLSENNDEATADYPNDIQKHTE